MQHCIKYSFNKPIKQFAIDHTHILPQMSASSEVVWITSGNLYSQHNERLAIKLHVLAIWPLWDFILKVYVDIVHVSPCPHLYAICFE